jgi:GAF domain-containing protein
MSTDTQTIRHLQQENIRLRSENNSLRDYVERLQRAMSALVALEQGLKQIKAETNVFQLVHTVLQKAMDAVDSENGSMALLDEESGDLVFVEVIGESREKLLNYRLPRGQGIAHWTLKNKTPRLVENVRNDPSFSSLVDQRTGLSTTSLICVPMFDVQRPLGVIEVVNTRSGRPFVEDDKEVMKLVGFLAARAIVTAENLQGG